MTRQDAIEIARKLLDANPIGVDGFRWKLTEPRSVPDGWLFEYCFERVDGSEEEPPVGLGGAPGFLVGHDSEVRDLSWEECQALGG